jgi:hypothetical protein
MADVHIRREKCTNLPALCMRCGAAATGFVDQTFTTSPGWVIFLIFVGFFPYMIAEFVFRLVNRMKVEVPVCKRHYNHFFNRIAGFYAGVVQVVVVPLIAYYCLSNNVDIVEVWWIGASLTLFFVAGLFQIVYFSLSGIKAYDLTRDGMYICGVSQQFAKAYEDSFYYLAEGELVEKRPQEKKKANNHPFGVKERD